MSAPAKRSVARQTSWLTGLRQGVARRVHRLVHPGFEREQQRLADLGAAVEQHMQAERAELATIGDQLRQVLKGSHRQSELLDALRRRTDRVEGIVAEQREAVREQADHVERVLKIVNGFRVDIERQGETLDQHRLALGGASREVQSLQRRFDLLTATMERVRLWLAAGGGATGDVGVRAREELAALPEQAWPAQSHLLSQLSASFAAERQGLLEQIRAAEATVQDLARDLASRYVESLGPGWAGQQAKTATKQIEDQELRDAIRVHLGERRDRLIQDVIAAGSVGWEQPLPAAGRYGSGMDERVIELPLAIEVADLERPGRVLDAGASLNVPAVRPQVMAGRARVLHYTQSADREPVVLAGDRVSFLFGDLRAIEFADGVFDRVVCVSTLEHIGMDNRRYGGAEEHDPDSYRRAFAELVRVLAPGGDLLVTVPFGARTDRGWFQVFDPDEVTAMRALARGCDVAVRYFTYDAGWADAPTPPAAPMAAATDVSAVDGLVALRVRKPPRQGGADAI